MKLFIQINGPQLFTYVSKIVHNDILSLNFSFEYLIEIILNQNNSANQIKQYTQKHPTVIPNIDTKRLVFLHEFDSLLLYNVNLHEGNTIILDIVNNLLTNPENVKIFKETLGVHFVF